MASTEEQAGQILKRAARADPERDRRVDARREELSVLPIAGLVDLAQRHGLNDEADRVTVAITRMVIAQTRLLSALAKHEVAQEMSGAEGKL